MREKEKKKETSRRDMLEWFDSMCIYLGVHGFTKRDERAVAIRKLIEEKQMKLIKIFLHWIQKKRKEHHAMPSKNYSPQYPDWYDLH